VVVSALRVVAPFIAVALLGVSAHAEEKTVGDTTWALPGIVRVGVPGAAARRVAFAGHAGYGYTEAQAAGDGAHHRAFGGLAVGLAPISSLEFGLRFDGRYDHHPDDGAGSHGAMVGDPRLLARAGGKVGGGFRVGGEVGAWFPGNDAPSLVLSATTLDLAFLTAWTADSGTTVAFKAGFLLDNSHNAAPEPSRFRFGDRLALGLSDFNAVPVGLGISLPLSKTEVLAETSASFLIGSGAPPISQSPIRVTGGIRHHLSDALSLLALLEVSASSRPDLSPTAPLVPVEPRVSGLVGLSYRLPFDKPVEAQATDQQIAPTGPENKPPPAPAATASVSVVVHKPDGSPASDAVVTVKVGTFEKRADAAADGKFKVDGIPEGDGEVEISAEGTETVKKPVHFGAGSTADLDVGLSKAMPQGEVRGLIRSFNGKGLAAAIRVEPLGVETKADAQGSFKIDVPPGDYEVVIRADNYKEQRRKVHVDQNGVTVLNAEMFEGRK
jgi:hypothetical protein